MTRPGLNICQHGLGLDAEQNNLRADHKSRKQTERGGQPVESVWQHNTVVLNVLKGCQPLGQAYTMCFYYSLKMIFTLYFALGQYVWHENLKSTCVILRLGQQLLNKNPKRPKPKPCSSVAQPQGVKDSRLCLHNVQRAPADSIPDRIPNLPPVISSCDPDYTASI